MAVCCPISMQAVLAMLLSVGIGGCDGMTDDDTAAADDDAPDDDDTIPSDDDAADDDDSAEPCVPTIEWGFGGAFEVGEVVGNWALSGYIDGDGDGVVEPTEVTFDLEDIHCGGFESLAVVAGDST